MPSCCLEFGREPTSEGFRPHSWQRAQAIDSHLTWISDRDLICPSCQLVTGAFACDDGQITGISSRVSRPHEGRIAIVTDVGCGMRWTRQSRKTNDSRCVRQSHAVLSPRCWRQVGEDAFGFAASDGDNKAGLRGEHGISRRTVARGKPDDPAVPVVTNSCAFLYAREAMGACRAPGFPCALTQGGTCLATTRAQFRAARTPTPGLC